MGCSISVCPVLVIKYISSSKLNIRGVVKKFCCECDRFVKCAYEGCSTNIVWSAKEIARKTKDMSVTAWIVAVAWIVAGDNSCWCLRHKSSPATIHAVSVSMNCRRRQFMPEISLMLCTSPAIIHAAWKKIIGIYCRRRHILTPSRPIFIYNFFIYLLFFFYLVKVQMNFSVIRHIQIYKTKIIGCRSKRTHAKTYPTKTYPILVKTYPLFWSKRTQSTKTYPTFWSKRTQYIFFFLLRFPTLVGNLSVFVLSFLRYYSFSLFSFFLYHLVRSAITLSILDRFTSNFHSTMIVTRQIDSYTCQ